MKGWVFISVLSVLAKQLTTVITLTENEPWKYLTKFAMIPGKGNYEIKAQLVSPINSAIEDIPLKAIINKDTKWQDSLSEQDCSKKHITSSYYHNLIVPNNGEWSQLYSGYLSQTDKTLFWYFSISSCSLTQRLKIRIEISLINSNDSEFSAEDMNLEYAYPIILLIYFFFLSRNMLKIVIAYDKNDDVPLSLFILNGSMLTQFCGILFKIVHLWVYWYNGKGVMFFDVISQALEVISCIFVSILFILIASGWTLKFKEFPDADIYIPISMLIIAVNLVVIAIGKITDDAYNKFTDYEGLPGFFIILLRVMSWVWFLFLEKELEKNANLRLKNFLFNFLICVSAYFLSLPLVVLSSWVFEPYSRKIVIFTLNNLVQIFIFSYTSHLLSEKSEFYHLSDFSRSVLPMEKLN